MSVLTTASEQANDEEPRTFADVENGDPDDLLEELDPAIL
jgi:hypothetical protein